MKSFKISTYNISSTRLTGKQKVTFAILADLHGLVFGKNHQTLYKAIIASQPDAVLVCGDLVVSRDTETLEAAAGLLLRICDLYDWNIVNVYFVFLNQMEQKVKRTFEYINFNRYCHLQCSFTDFVDWGYRFIRTSSLGLWIRTGMVCSPRPALTIICCFPFLNSPQQNGGKSRY